MIVYPSIQLIRRAGWKPKKSSCPHSLFLNYMIPHYISVRCVNAETASVCGHASSPIDTDVLADGVL